ncbi:MAG: helix-turn-helix domain-containing protein [Pseudomonadota bacterium]|nr:helix-turn-helix domain-containing protein [Pseudomonadota bacterium]
MPLKIRKNKSPPPPLCPLTECMQLISGVWAANVVWYLRGGPRRFSELRIDIPRASAKVLTARLRELEDKGVIRRTVKATSPPSVEYELTDLGAELMPAIDAIAAVGMKLKTKELQRKAG